MLLLAMALSLAAPAQTPMTTSATDSVANGYYSLGTTINDSPATMGIRVSRPDGTLLVEFFPAMGGGPVRARTANLDGRKLHAVVAVHDGFEIELRLQFQGDTVTGTWSLGGDENPVTGKKARDPASG